MPFCNFNFVVADLFNIVVFLVVTAAHTQDKGDLTPTGTNKVCQTVQNFKRPVVLPLARTYNFLLFLTIVLFSGNNSFAYSRRALLSNV